MNKSLVSRVALAYEWACVVHGCSPLEWFEALWAAGVDKPPAVRIRVLRAATLVLADACDSMSSEDAAALVDRMDACRRTLWSEYAGPPQPLN
jgi:hypothetical protein